MLSSIANDSSAVERKKEIEMKKARLEELRSQRMQRSNSQQSFTQPSLAKTLTFEEIDELVNSLIGPKAEVKVEVQKPEKFAEKPKPKHLDFKIVESTEIIPEGVISYSKEMQTDDIPDVLDQQTSVILNDQAMDTIPAVEESVGVEDSESVEQVSAAPLDLEKILHSDSFTKFFGQSSKIMERALNSKDEYDIFKDYRIVENAVGVEKQVVHLKCTFAHDRWTKNRAVTSIDWSPHFPELVLASFGKNSGNVNESDGLVLVWNIHMPQSPEFILFAQVFVTFISSLT